MSKKRGLSAEEKKIKMLEIFHQSRDFYQLKELEKIAPKEKGITMQSVKEVIQTLVDDHLVDSEKIGTSIYFWSFPSKAKHALKRKLKDVQNELDDCVSKIKKCEDSINTETLDRVENAERTEILSLLEEVTKKEADVMKEMQKYKDSDPEYIEQLKDNSEELKTAINRWTENIYILKSYCMCSTFNADNETIEQNFDIPADLDYLN